MKRIAEVKVNRQKVRVTHSETLDKLGKANVTQLKQIKAVAMETMEDTFVRPYSDEEWQIDLV